MNVWAFIALLIKACGSNFKIPKEKKNSLRKLFYGKTYGSDCPTDFLRTQRIRLLRVNELHRLHMQLSYGPLVTLSRRQRRAG